MNEENQMPENYNQQETNNKGNFGWAVLGFFIPIVGFILYFVWKDKKPGDAKKAGIGGVVGFCFNLFVTFVVPRLLWGNVQNNIADSACKTYGESYKAVRRGNAWYCENKLTGDRIELE